MPNTQVFRRGGPLIAAAGAAMAALLALSGCSSGGTASTSSGDSSGKPASGGSITYTFRDTSICLDPQQSFLHPDLNMTRQVADSLLDQDPKTGKLVPWLASAWTVNSDATEYTFTIRDGVTFSDGSKLTADVVKENFDSVVALGTKSLMGPTYFQNYIGTTVTPDGKVDVKFSKPNSPFLQATASINLAILSEKTTQEDATTRCSNGVVGSGPFVISKVTAGQNVVETKRKGYDWASSVEKHKGDAYLDQITFQYASEDSVRTGMLQSDQTQGISNVDQQDEPTLEKSGFQVLSRANPGLSDYLLLNFTNPALQDENVRKGLQAALNRQEIYKTVDVATQKPATSILSSSTTGWVDESQYLKHDVSAAQKDFEASGYAKGSDGIYAKDGKKLEFSLISTNDAMTQATLQLVQQEFKAAGVLVDLHPLASADWNNQAAAGSFDLDWANLTRNDPDVLRTRFLSTASGNFGKLSDPALDALLTKQAAEPDPTARNALVKQAQDLMMQKAYVLPIDEQTQIHALSPKLHGVVFESSSRLRFYDAWLEK